MKQQQKSLGGSASLLLVGLLAFTWLSARARQDSQARQEERDSSRYFQKWLDEDVAYIITDEERDVFNKLTNAEEKDQFIEQFWQRRDSDLTTAFNEFREEHYRRVAYVNEHYGSGIPGWKTDRGRVYIMFGEPAQTEYYAGGNYVRAPYEGGGRTATYPFEIWRYRYISGVGEDIEIEFVDRSMTGEFKMAIWPWEKDMLLHVDGLGETTAERLGRTSRAMRPGLHPGNLNNTHYMKSYLGARFKDRPFERMRQYFMLQRPPEIEQKELLKIVDTRISYDTLPIAADLYHVWIDDLTALLPITIEIPNKELDYVSSGGSFKARVGIYGRVTSMAGRIEAEFEHTLVSQFPEAYLELAQQQASLFQKTVALPAGRHKVDLVVKDLGSGDVGTLARSVSLEFPKEDHLSLGTIVLAEQVEPLESFPETPETFVVGDVRVVPKVGRIFKASEDLGVYLQVYNPFLDSASAEPAVTVEYTIRKGNQVMEQFVDGEGSSVEFFSAQRLVLVNKMPLARLGKGRYRLTVKIDDSITGQSVSGQADFEIFGD